MGERRNLIARAERAEQENVELRAKLAASEARTELLLANQQTMASQERRSDPDWPGSRL